MSLEGVRKAGVMSPDEKKSELPRIPDFYNGRSIFITGAAGFLGVVLLETLLRCCTGIKTIYILLREKKGVQPEDRIKSIFSRKIFTKLRDECPDVSAKVRVVGGDVSKPSMGLGEEDSWGEGSIMRDIINEVSIVFHCAANINFLKPFSYLLKDNVDGTNNVIQLCRKMKKMEVLVYSSTAYCNSNRKVMIEERVYGLPYPPQRFLEVASRGDEDTLAEMVSQCQPPWPNNYCLSKCVSECLLEQVQDFQVVIVRPAIICQTWKGPMAGYGEKNSNLAQICLGIGKGFMKAIIGKENETMDIVPCDLVANTHIASAWYSVLHRSPSPLVINCTSYGSYRITFGEITSVAQSFSAKYPLPNTMRSSAYCVVIDSEILYKLFTLVEHYIPALGIDLYLMVNGKSPRLLPLYRFLDKVMKTSMYFSMNSWKFEVKNFKELQRVLKPEDEPDFYMNGDTLELDELMDNLPHGSPFFDWALDVKTREQRLRQAHRTLVFTRIIQIVFFLILFWLIYLIAGFIISYL